MEIKEMPMAAAGMLIRRPVAEVFEAFVDPATTTKFWFTHGSGRLNAGKEVRWEWRMVAGSQATLMRPVRTNLRSIISRQNRSNKEKFSDSVRHPFAAAVTEEASVPDMAGIGDQYY